MSRNLQVLQDDETCLYLELPGLHELDEGYFVSVIKRSGFWEYKVEDQGCDMLLSEGTCQPSIEALFSTLMNPE